MSTAVAWAGVILAIALSLAALGVMVGGLVRQLGQLRTQMRQEWRPPTSSSNPELAERAQALLDDLCDQAGRPRVEVTVVPILGRPAPTSVAGLGTGGPAVTRFRLNQPASILLASGAGVLSRAGLASLLAHELAHAAAHATRRSVLRHYALALPFFLLVPLMIWIAIAVSVSLATLVAGLAALLVLLWWTHLSRRQETAADLYAIDLTRDIHGAAELMDLYISARQDEKRRGGKVIRVLDERYLGTHPTPETRLEAMRLRLSATTRPPAP